MQSLQCTSSLCLAAESPSSLSSTQNMGMVSCLSVSIHFIAVNSLSINPVKETILILPLYRNSTVIDANNTYSMYDFTAHQKFHDILT